MTHTILPGGRVLDIVAGTAEFADVLIEGDKLHHIGRFPSATEIRMARRLLHPSR